jgi:alkanesulfonate monooxygenase SsuD/methylene tetrahydromethanopterin reductase-like flavin-dependent oxidoreductase (luciferase family)
VVIDDDVERAADRLRAEYALYIGGMGARGANFHHDVFARMGFEAEAGRIQERYLAGDKAGAAAAVPTALVERVALVGPAAKIRDELAQWRDSVVDMLVVQGLPDDVDLVAEVLLG